MLNQLKQFNLKSNIGWQIFRLTDNSLYSLYKNKPVSKEIGWETDPSRKIIKVTYPVRFSYKSGFHVFTEKIKAQKYLESIGDVILSLYEEQYNKSELIIKKEKFANIVATGYMDFLDSNFSKITAKIVVVKKRLIFN